MMKYVVLVIFLLSSLALIEPEKTFAQSGNTGGRLGKSNKSISGKIKKSVTIRKPKQVNTKSQKPNNNFSGLWRWEVGCPLSGKWTGTFTISGSSKNVRIKYTEDHRPGSKEIVSGSINYKKIVFRRRAGALMQTWDAIISGADKKATITGSATHALESCKLRAYR